MKCFYSRQQTKMRRFRTLNYITAFETSKCNFTATKYKFNNAQATTKDVKQMWSCHYFFVKIYQVSLKLDQVTYGMRMVPTGSEL